MDDSKPRSPFDITELLEKVLLHLAQGDILKLQRVSRFWLNTISGSPSLQQKLFFQPLPPSKAAGRLPEFNPIVKLLFPFLFAPHPCLGAKMCKKTAETTTWWIWDAARRQAILRPEASWRRMLPVQPAAPIDGVLMADWLSGMLEWCPVDPSGHAPAVTSKSNPGDNATMGLLYDIILHHFSSESHTSIYVQWNMFRLTHDLEYGFHRPIRWQRSNIFDRRSSTKPEHYEKVKPRNTITIHVTTAPCDGACFWSWASSTGLGVLLDLPTGVVRTGDQANRYPLANHSETYTRYGKIAPELRSELEIERRERSEQAEDRDIIHGLYMAFLGERDEIDEFS